MTTTEAPARLPRIVAFLGGTDAGDGGTNCPHCGAEGRYVLTFRCDDGSTRGAMRGCVKLSPVSPVAAEHKKIIERQRERAAKGQKLASWDLAKLDAIERFAAGEITEDACRLSILNENVKRANWMSKKGYRR